MVCDSNWKSKAELKQLKGESRREKSKHAARSRREIEGSIYVTLQETVPLVNEPTISHVDRIAVLRLATTYFRLRELAPKLCAGSKTSLTSNLRNCEFLQSSDLLPQCLDGFMLLTTEDNTLLYVSEGVSTFLGLTQTDLIGEDLFDNVHKDDIELFRKTLSRCRASSLSAPSTSARPTCSGNGNSYLQPANVQVRLKSVLTYRGRQLSLRSATYKVVNLYIQPVQVEVSSPPLLQTSSSVSNDESGAGPSNGPLPSAKSSKTGKSRGKAKGGGKKAPRNEDPGSPMSPASTDGGPRPPTAASSSVGLYFLMFAVPVNVSITAAPSAERNSLERSTKAVHNSRHFIDFKFNYLDERMAELLGYEASLLIGHSLFELIHAEDVHRFRNGFRNLREMQQASFGFYRLLVKGGGCIWVFTDAQIVSQGTRGSRSDYIVCIHQFVDGPPTSEKLPVIASVQWGQFAKTPKDVAAEDRAPLLSTDHGEDDQAAFALLTPEASNGDFLSKGAPAFPPGRVGAKTSTASSSLVKNAAGSASNKRKLHATTASIQQPNRVDAAVTSILLAAKSKQLKSGAATDVKREPVSVLPGGGLDDDYVPSCVSGSQMETTSRGYAKRPFVVKTEPFSIDEPGNDRSFSWRDRDECSNLSVASVQSGIPTSPVSSFVPSGSAKVSPNYSARDCGDDELAVILNQIEKIEPTLFDDLDVVAPFVDHGEMLPLNAAIATLDASIWRLFDEYAQPAAVVGANDEMLPLSDISRYGNFNSQLGTRASSSSQPCSSGPAGINTSNVMNIGNHGITTNQSNSNIAASMVNDLSASKNVTVRGLPSSCANRRLVVNVATGEIRPCSRSPRVMADDGSCGGSDADVATNGFCSPTMQGQAALQSPNAAILVRRKNTNDGSNNVAGVYFGNRSPTHLSPSLQQQNNATEGHKSTNALTPSYGTATNSFAFDQPSCSRSLQQAEQQAAHQQMLNDARISAYQAANSTAAAPINASHQQQPQQTYCNGVERTQSTRYEEQMPQTSHFNEGGARKRSGCSILESRLTSPPLLLANGGAEPQFVLVTNGDAAAASVAAPLNGPMVAGNDGFALLANDNNNGNACSVQRATANGVVSLKSSRKRYFRHVHNSAFCCDPRCNLNATGSSGGNVCYATNQQQAMPQMASASHYRQQQGGANAPQAKMEYGDSAIYDMQAAYRDIAVSMHGQQNW